MSKNIFYIGKKWVFTRKIENYSNIIPRTVIQHKCSIFMEQLPNRNSKLKFDYPYDTEDVKTALL